MAAYRNDTKGARAIHLHTGNHVLVEAGATVEVESYRVKRLAPGIVVAKSDKLSKPPAKAVAAVAGKAKAPAKKRTPRKSRAKAPAKAKAAAKPAA
jgi:hypothetical protein